MIYMFHQRTHLLLLQNDQIKAQIKANLAVVEVVVKQLSQLYHLV